MEGVILFADDAVFSNSFENKLFKKLSKVLDYPVLPIDNLTDLQKTTTAVSTFRALLLDWEFIEELEGVKSKDTPLNILLSNDFYSLIFIYSQIDIGEEPKEKLKAKFGEKIDFLPKVKEQEQIDSETEKISIELKKFEDSNKHLEVPFLWSQTINKSAQDIFRELELADPNWIKEIYNTAKKDGAEPRLEVIEVFQYLLSEQIIQNKDLLSAIEGLVDTKEGDEVEQNEQSLAKLYQRIYYTKLIEDAPLNTGDIFILGEDVYGILITPECDLNKKKDGAMEFLQFKKSVSKSFIDKKKKKNELSIFNNGVQNRHLLPSFPFVKAEYNRSALIKFENAFVVIDKDGYNEKRSKYKLNSPYIFQLRQRYLAYVGRVGVPAIPESLRNFNLK